jgi:hypothetical protein
VLQHKLSLWPAHPGSGTVPRYQTSYNPEETIHNKPIAQLTHVVKLTRREACASPTLKHTLKPQNLISIHRTANATHAVIELLNCPLVIKAGARFKTFLQSLNAKSSIIEHRRQCTAAAWPVHPRMAHSCDRCAISQRRGALAGSCPWPPGTCGAAAPGAPAATHCAGMTCRWA